MPILSLVVILVIIGVIMWAVNTYIPMESTIKKILNVVVVIAVCLWLLGVFGILPDVANIRVGRN